MTGISSFRLLRGALLAAVPVIAVAVFGFEAASAPIGQLPQVPDVSVATAAQTARSVEAAATDSPVVDVNDTTWEETRRRIHRRPRPQSGFRR